MPQDQLDRAVAAAATGSEPPASSQAATREATLLWVSRSRALAGCTQLHRQVYALMLLVKQIPDGKSEGSKFGDGHLVNGSVHSGPQVRTVGRTTIAQWSRDLINT